MKTYGPYSPTRRAGNLVFVSGQVGIDSKSGKAASDISKQSHQALANLQSVLQSIATLDDVVKTTIFLRNMDDFAVFNKVYLEYFPATLRPARSCVEVSGLPRIGNVPLLIEIEAIVYTGDKE